jgi:sirohydrochlorin cobaltochelatase
VKEGIVLLAHGSRDPEWSRPFVQLAAMLSRRLPAVEVAVCYLEHGPSFGEATAALIAKGTGSIRVIPVFLGQGSHVKQDLPRLVAATQRDYPGTPLRLEPAIGEQAQVIEAIAGAIAGASSPGSGAR